MREGPSRRQHCEAVPPQQQPPAPAPALATHVVQRARRGSCSHALAGRRPLGCGAGRAHGELALQRGRERQRGGGVVAVGAACKVAAAAHGCRVNPTVGQLISRGDPRVCRRRRGNQPFGQGAGGRVLGLPGGVCKGCRCAGLLMCGCSRVGAGGCVLGPLAVVCRGAVLGAEAAVAPAGSGAGVVALRGGSGEPAAVDASGLESVGVPGLSAGGWSWGPSLPLVLPRGGESASAYRRTHWPLVMPDVSCTCK